jgi:hypothetical protein
VREQVVQPIRASGVPADWRGSSFNHVTPVCAAGDLARGRAVEGAKALRRRTALHWGGWLIEVARSRGLPLADLRLYVIAGAETQSEIFIEEVDKVVAPSGQLMQSCILTLLLYVPCAHAWQSLPPKPALHKQADDWLLPTSNVVLFG